MRSSRFDYALEDQIRLVRLEQERNAAAERSRFALALTAQRTIEAKRDQEWQEEKRCLFRRIDKSEENDAWATEWRKGVGQSCSDELINRPMVASLIGISICLLLSFT